jgi:histidinol dehydrogenase
VRDLDEACALANCIAPEHRVDVANPTCCSGRIRHAGAIFLGHHVESLGDWRRAEPRCRLRRAILSPLGVYDFQKRTGMLRVSAAGARTLGPVAATLARGEGLAAHAQSALYRVPQR